ncbi:MAG: glutamate racemase [Lachnospira sp.]
MKIGIFDSGIGGLSLLHQAMISLPEVDYMFYADVDNVPYGEKTNDEIKTFVDHAVGFLVENDCRAVVLACNTATSVAISYLRDKYRIPIIGIEPAVKPAVEHCGNRRIMVVATTVTAQGAKLKNLIMRYDTSNLVDVVPLPGLVRFAQNDEFDSDEVRNYLNNEFAGYDLNEYSELVLGCTHFNYFKDSFAKIFPEDIDMVDGNLGVSNNLKRTLEANGLLDGISAGSRGNVEYYYSDRRVVAGNELEHIMKLHERLENMRKI